MEDIIFALELTATGLVVVFSALVSVALIVKLFQQIDRPKPPTVAPAAPPRQESAPPAQLASSVPESDDGTISPEVAAAIAAAVAIATSRKGRIRRIRYRSPQSTAGAAETAWSRQGRVSIMTSHLPKQ